MLNILNETINTGNKLLTVLKSVKDQLWGNEEAAFGKLSEALDELMKFYDATGKEISQFQGLSFSIPNNLQLNKTALAEFESGMMAVRIENARGHCQKIERIYKDDLDKWFRKALGDSNSFYQLKDAFADLAFFDMKMFAATEELAGYLVQEATEVLNFVNLKEYDKADQRINDSRTVLRPAKKGISEFLQSMVLLKNELNKRV